jgi:NAD+ kinase
VPISAHALFAGPMVVSPRSVLAAEVIGAVGGQVPASIRPAGQPRAQGAVEVQSLSAHPETAGAVLWCDGRRTVDLPPGSRVEVRRGSLPVLLARLPAAADATAANGGAEARIGAPFTDRLVAKFGLPVAGWRGLHGDRSRTGETVTEETVTEETVTEETVTEEPGSHA